MRISTRTRIVVLIVALAAIAPASSLAQEETSVAYRLLNTRVVVTGTVTSKVSFDTDKREYAPGDVALNLVAEPDAAVLQFDPASAVLSKETLTVQVGVNGALRSVNGISEGQVGAVIRNIFSAVLGAVNVVGATRLSAGASKAEQRYQTDYKDEENRRKTLRAAIDEAVQKVADTGRAAAAETDANRLKALSTRIDALLAVIKTLRSELEPLDARFTSWKTQFQDAKTEAFVYRLNASDLPDDSAVSALLGKPQTPDAIAAALNGASKEIYRTLGAVITKIDAGAASGRPMPSGNRNTLYYRLPRPVVFKLYSLGIVENENRLVLRRVSAENVIDEFSPVQSVTLTASKWVRKSLSASFSDSGALAQFSNERSSAAAAAADLAKNLPADYVEALRQANDMAGERRKLALQAIDARIERLNREKSEKEASLALREVDDVGALKEQIAKLDAETKLLDSQRTLQAAGDAGEAGRALHAEQQVLALENAIAAARAERLELEAKLERLRQEVKK